MLNSKPPNKRSPDCAHYGRRGNGTRPANTSDVMPVKVSAYGSKYYSDDG